ncbi:MAG: riboflavin biosynthesis protein RibF [Akkermansia sp.]
MKLLHSIAALRALPRPVHLALGFFDGVHLGHRRVIESTDSPGALRGVLSFAEHPLALLAPERCPKLISPGQRAELLAALGVELLVLLPFDRTLAETSAEDFWAQLRATGRVCGLSVGCNQRFGRGGAGTPEQLRAWGAAAGIRVRVCELAQLDGERISSSRIRALLAAGDLERATAMLGHPYCIAGTVEPGQRLARQWGFPTANIALPDGAATPPRGVYAVSCRYGARLLRGVANLGLRPSIREAHKQLRLETHFLEFEGNLYGERLCVALDRFLRPERCFGSAEELRAAIAADVAAARALLPA